MTLTAVLLAGGESRRMGEDKATILFRGQPLWQIQLDLLRKLQPEEIFISARVDPPWRPADVQFISDDPPSRGPLSGLTGTLAQIQTDYLLALAVDMPFMTESYLRGLCERSEQGRGVVPVLENRFEPMAAIYPRDAYEDVISALSSGDFLLQSLVKKLIAAGKLQSTQVSEEEKPFFRNLNEPRDLDDR